MSSKTITTDVYGGFTSSKYDVELYSGHINLDEPTTNNDGVEQVKEDVTGLKIKIEQLTSKITENESIMDLMKCRTIQNFVNIKQFIDKRIIKEDNKVLWLDKLTAEINKCLKDDVQKLDWMEVKKVTLELGFPWIPSSNSYSCRGYVIAGDNKRATQILSPRSPQPGVSSPTVNIIHNK
jgi:hypothetical protein